jgi:hypothetical protein
MLTREKLGDGEIRQPLSIKGIFPHDFSNRGNIFGLRDHNTPRPWIFSSGYKEISCIIIFLQKSHMILHRCIDLRE